MAGLVPRTGAELFNPLDVEYSDGAFTVDGKRLVKGRRLGAGWTGDVHEYTGAEGAGSVAIKEEDADALQTLFGILPDAVRSIHAKVLAARVPGTVWPIHYLGVHDRRGKRVHLSAMPVYAGTAEDYLKSNPGEREEIGAAVKSTVDNLILKGIYPRDIKLDNIFYDRDHRFYLGDITHWTAKKSNSHAQLADAFRTFADMC